MDVTSIVSALCLTMTLTLCQGEKARTCSGQQFLPNQCPSGSIITIVSTVGGFGTSNTPCYTSTPECTTVYLQRALPEVNGNLAAFVKGTCENKQTCSFTVDSSWQSASSYCQSKVYDIVYVDVEFNCNIRVAPSSTGSIKATTVDITTFDNGSGVPTTEVINSPASSTESTTTDPIHEVSRIKSYWFYFGGFASGVLITGIVVLAVYCIRRRKRQQRDNVNDVYLQTQLPTQNMTSSSKYETINPPSTATGPSVYDSLSCPQNNFQ